MSTTDEPVPQREGEDEGVFAEQVAERVSELMSPSLTSMTPRGAVDKYFENRDLKPATKRTQESSLRNHFVPWCEDVAGIEDMNALGGSDLADYRVWRRDEASDRVDKLSPKSEESQQKITRTFIEYCETWEGVSPGLHEFVIVPTLDDADEVRDEVLDSETAKDILSWLRKYEYASRQHVVWLLLSGCGARLGAVHSLDADDYVRDDDGGYLKLRHRPESETTLKNGEDGDRNVSISDRVCDTLDDYIEDAREVVTDEYGREPLLTTKHGRLAKTTIRNYIYAWTRPCEIGQGCPYGRDVDECDAAQRKQWASHCPESLSSHPIRKGYITRELTTGVPKGLVSERCDVSEGMIDKHYDFRTEEEKMKARRVARKMALDSEQGYGE